MSLSTLKEKAQKFLSCRNIAVIGVSGTNEQEAANYNFKKLKALGYNVFPVNPNLSSFSDQKCYLSVRDIEAEVEAALVFTHPDITGEVVQQCHERGIPNLWIHRSFGEGSCSGKATLFMKDKGDVNFIDGACPMMFHKNADLAHRCFYHILKFAGKLPR